MIDSIASRFLHWRDYMVAPLVLLLGQALVQAVTKPWPWLTLIGFFALAKFDLGVFREEFTATLWELWPFVILVILLWFALLFARSYWELSNTKKKR